MKMKKTTVCWTCFRSRLVSSSGRINSIAAPVVPMKLASTAPAARNAQFVNGWAGRSPSMRMPPLIVYRLNSRTMNGMYSPRIALASTSPVWATFSPAADGNATCGAGQWAWTGARAATGSRPT